MLTIYTKLGFATAVVTRSVKTHAIAGGVIGSEGGFVHIVYLRLMGFSFVVGCTCAIQLRKL
jgi:hypothetical protein